MDPYWLTRYEVAFFVAVMLLPCAAALSCVWTLMSWGDDLCKRSRYWGLLTALLLFIATIGVFLAPWPSELREAAKTKPVVEQLEKR